MNNINQMFVTRTALLLALTLISQSLRMFIPIPPFISIFVIGSLVNACLLISAQSVNLWSGIIIAIIAPVVAYFQGQLPLWIFIIPVSFGNCIIVIIHNYILKYSKMWAILLASLAKSVFLYISFYSLITLINIPPKISAFLMLAMSWPQFITGLIGGSLAFIISERLKKLNC